MARFSPVTSLRSTGNPFDRYGAALARALALFSLLFLAGQMLLPVVHRALVQHEVCAQHGEWVHGHDTESQAPAVHTKQGYFPGDVDHQHGHCEVCGGMHHELGLAARHTSAAPVVLARSQVDVLSAGVFSALGSDRYRVAPKQGPPQRS